MHESSNDARTAAPVPALATERREGRARRRAKYLGLVVAKSRRRTLEIPGYRGYMLIDPTHNRIVAGAHPDAYSLNLDDLFEALMEANG